MGLTTHQRLLPCGSEPKALLIRNCLWKLWEFHASKQLSCKLKSIKIATKEMQTHYLAQERINPSRGLHFSLQTSPASWKRRQKATVTQRLQTSLGNPEKKEPSLPSALMQSSKCSLDTSFQAPTKLLLMVLWRVQPRSRGDPGGSVRCWSLRRRFSKTPMAREAHRDPMGKGRVRRRQ